MSIIEPKWYLCIKPFIYKILFTWYIQTSNITFHLFFICLKVMSDISIFKKSKHFCKFKCLCKKYSLQNSQINYPKRSLINLLYMKYLILILKLPKWDHYSCSNSNHQKAPRKNNHLAWYQCQHQVQGTKLIPDPNISTH